MTLEQGEKEFLEYLGLLAEEIGELDNLLYQNPEYLSEIDSTSSKVNTHSDGIIDIVIYAKGGSGRNMGVAIETSKGDVISIFRIGIKYYRTSIKDVLGVNAKLLELGINFQFSTFE